MVEAEINFFSEDTSFSLVNPSLISEWIIKTIHSENFLLESLNIIFCSDPYLLSINQEFLGHDYFTDIITFDNSDLEFSIEGELYISIDRVTDNSLGFNVSFDFELLRVIIHGVLHLLGYSDKNDFDSNIMREKENYYLTLLNF